ncbi:REP-associated tyrosine transposase [Piscinibacter defluvii]|uniref:REP-associated tyrosine transposase n=1 Tax=Piscinibacter defluvii TaxID=1796922 RepID=UPI000FDDD8D4|nr:transposase [Piscinibacter defluvii]
MARPLRLEWPGALYHVTSRGDRREPIVEDDDDRQSWVALLGEACARFGWRVHAWCLMTNHYHLLLETPHGRLAEGMRHLNGVWSQRFNRRHGRVGHVFQGRYTAIMVEKESYLLELSRYVVLNPVRARMVADAADYPWSSHTAMLARSDRFPPAPQPAWLETDVVLKQFGPTRRRAVAAYVDFVRAGVGLPSVWDALRGQVFLGSDEFVQRMTAALDADDPQLRDVPRLQRRPPPRGLRALCAQTLPGSGATPDRRAQRDAAMAAAYATGHHTLRAIADAFGVHEATVSRALRRQPIGRQTRGGE